MVVYGIILTFQLPVYPNRCPGTRNWTWGVGSEFAQYILQFLTMSWWRKQKLWSDNFINLW